MNAKGKRSMRCISVTAFDERLVALFEDGRVYVRHSSEPEDDAWMMMDDPDDDMKVIEESKKVARELGVLGGQHSKKK